MRCHQARQKLDELGRNTAEMANDADLMKHLKSCSECASLANAEKLLNRDFITESADDTTETVTFAEMRARVESLAGREVVKPSSKEKGIMAKLFAKPRYSLSLAAVAVIILAVTLLPIRFNDNLGYEVAIAGVDKDLALDEDRVCELLVAVGIEDCDFKIEGCEETCRIKVQNLKSEDEMKVVCVAFGEMENCEVADIYEISEDGDVTFFGDKDGLIYELKNDSDNNIFVAVQGQIGKLNDEHDGLFNIWISEDGDVSGLSNGDISIVCDSLIKGQHGCDSNIMIMDINGNLMCGDSMTALIRTINVTGDGDLHKIIELTAGNATSEDCKMIIMDDNSGDHIVDLDNASFRFSGDNGEVSTIIVETVDGESIFKIETPDGEVFEIDPKADDFVERLRELGFYVKIDDGGNTIFVSDENADDDTAANSSDDSEDVAEKTTDDVATVLPNSFELHQNYPNPFNPTTSIIFFLPQSANARLEIYNMNGRKVKTLVDEYMEAGSHSVVWNSRDDNGEKVASGVYLYKLTAGDFSESKKMTLMK